jgi:hypothetical protein
MADDEMPEVRELYGRTFGSAAEGAWIQRHRWELFENPAGLGKRWVARVDGNLSGFVAGLPVRMKIGGSVHHVLAPCDLMTSVESRGHSLGWRLLRRLVVDAGPLTCSLACSAAAGKLYDALDWKSLDVVPVAVRPRDLGAIGARLLSDKGIRLGRRGRAAAGAVGAALDRITWPRVRPDFCVTRAASVPDGIDALWHRVSIAFPVVGVRDRAFVKWRFFDDPAMTHDFIVARVHGELRGWAATAVVEKRGLAWGKLMDLFCDPFDRHTVRALLRGALSAFAERGAAIIVTKGLHPAIRSAIARYFPIRRRALPARVTWHGTPALASFVHDATGWHATHADGDEDMTP